MPDWSAAAACLDADPEMFFPPGEGRMSWARIAEAKDVCVRCPVARPCLEFALHADAQYGVWGGTTPRERKQITRDRSRQDLRRRRLTLDAIPAGQ